MARELPADHAHAGLTKPASSSACLKSLGGNSLVIQTLDGNRREIARSSVEALHSSGKSFMPEGLETELDAQSLADVIAYIQSL